MLSASMWSGMGRSMCDANSSINARDLRPVNPTLAWRLLAASALLIQLRLQRCVSAMWWQFAAKVGHSWQQEEYLHKRSQCDSSNP